MCGAKRRTGREGGKQHRQTGKVARESRVTPLNNHRVIANAERDGTSPMGAFCRGRGDRGGCAKDGLSWWGCPTWVTGVGLVLSVLPRTAKLVMLHVIGNEKENLRAEVDSRENCLIVRLFGLFDCYWCYSSFKRRSATPRTQTQQAPAPVATQD